MTSLGRKQEDAAEVRRLQALVAGFTDEQIEADLAIVLKALKPSPRRMLVCSESHQRWRDMLLLERSRRRARAAGAE